MTRFSDTIALLLRLHVALACALALAAQSALAQEDKAYEIDRLPQAALTAPEDFDLSNPRGTLYSFTRAADADAFEIAGAALMVPEGTERSPAELARMLSEVIDRKLWIDGGALPDRPDALIETVGDDPRAGQTRRSIALGTIDRDSFPVTIRINRYRADTGAMVWLFSRDTVASIPSLYAAHGPGWLELQLPPWWRERSPLSVRHWEVAALPLLLLAAGAVALGIHAALSKLAGRSRGGWRTRGLGASAAPLAILGATILCQAVINSALGFSGEITSVLTPVLIAGIIIALLMAVLRIIDAGLDVVTNRYVGEIDDTYSRDERHFYTSIYALRRVVTLVAVTVGAGLIFRELGIFRDVGISLLASAGVATVILGIAGQTILGNILASLQIAFAKPIRIGDSVHYEGEWAYVEAIFYTYVRLRTWDERRLMVPVKYFVSKPFENWSMIDARMIRTFSIVVDHMADTDALREKFTALTREDDEVIGKDQAKMLVMGHDADGVHCRFYAMAPDPTTAWGMHARLREEMLRWIRTEHPQWWPRERVTSLPGSAGEPTRTDLDEPSD